MNEFNDIFKGIKRQSLTDSERAAMRNNLSFYMSEHAPRAPFSVRMSDALARYASAFDTSSLSHMRLAPAALSLFLIVGVGTTYAAEQALPGEALYGVKIHINESVLGSFAISHAAQADWNTELVTRRLEEAETLFAEDRLTPVARSQIESQIILTGAKFDESVSELAKTEGETAVAAAQSNLEASLSGHVQVLTALAIDAPESEDALKPILDTVRVQAKAAQTARTTAEARVTAAQSDDGTKDDVKAAAIVKKEAATEALVTVRAKVSASKNSAKTSSSTRAAGTSAFDAQQTISEGDQKLKKGDYGRAFSRFQAAIRAVTAAEVNLDAAERLQTDLPVPANADTGTATGTEVKADVIVQ